jgi:hypothetical protein
LTPTSLNGFDFGTSSTEIAPNECRELDFCSVLV